MSRRGEAPDGLRNNGSWDRLTVRGRWWRSPSRFSMREGASTTGSGQEASTHWRGASWGAFGKPSSCKNVEVRRGAPCRSRGENRERGVAAQGTEDGMGGAGHEAAGTGPSTAEPGGL
jgi:hypothetical protein